MSVPGYRVHNFQLADMAIMENIGTSGGSLVVVTAGGTARVPLFDPDNGFVSLAQPVVAVRGRFQFATLEAVQDVDLYGVAPGGQSFVRLASKPQSKNEVWVNSNQSDHVMVIPFNAADFTIGSAVASGFTEPANAIFGGLGNAIKVVTVDATETLDVGNVTDPNGYQEAVSMAATGYFATKGLLIENVTTNEQRDHFSAGEAVQLTFSAGSDTAAGFAQLPYSLPVVGA